MTKRRRITAAASVAVLVQLAASQFLSIQAASLCNLGGNLTVTDGAPAVNTRVSLESARAAQSYAGTIIPPSSSSVFTDSNGNLPISPPVTLPQRAFALVTVGSRPPVQVQIPPAASADLSTVLLANTDPPSLLSVLSIESGSDFGLSVTNPGAGGVRTGLLQSGGITSLQGGPVAAVVPNPVQFLTQNASAKSWLPDITSGDLVASASTPGKLSVASLGGVSSPASIVGSGTTGGADTVANVSVNGVVNARAYGAVADGRYVSDGCVGTDCTGSPSNIVTSNQASTTYGGFNSGRDVGRQVTIVNPTTGAVVANTTISSVTNATTIVIRANISAGSGYLVYWGTDNSVAGQAAIDAIELGGNAGVSVGGTVYWPRPSAANLYYYFATSSGLQMSGSASTLASRARPVSFRGDPGTAQGWDATGESDTTFLIPAVPVTAVNTAARAAFLNYPGASGCIAGAKLEDLGFEAYVLSWGAGPVAISVNGNDGVFLGTQGHPLYAGRLGGLVQLYNYGNVPQCSSSTSLVAAFTETVEIYANMENAAQPLRYLVGDVATTTTTSGPVTLSGSGSMLNVGSTAGFPSAATSFAVTVKANSGGTQALGPTIQCSGLTSTTLTGCTGSGTVVSGATLANGGANSFNGSGCDFCLINRYATPAGVASIYFGPNSNVYDAPMNVHWWGNNQQPETLMQDDATSGVYGIVPWLHGYILGEAGGSSYTATGAPFRYRGKTLEGGIYPGSLWASDDLAADSGSQRNLIQNSEFLGTDYWTVNTGWSFQSGAQPDGGQGAFLAGTGAIDDTELTSAVINVDGHQVTDGAMTAGSSTLTSAIASWTAARDTLKYVSVTGAGPNGATLYGQITSVTNSTTVVLNTLAATTVSGATVTWGQYYSLSAYLDYSQGTSGSLGIGVCDPTITHLYTTMTFPVGTKSRANSLPFIPPGSQLVILFHGGTAISPIGTNLTISQPTLEALPFPMAYVPNVTVPLTTGQRYNPNLSFGVLGGSMGLTGTQTGSYSQIGNQVCFNIWESLSVVGSSTGAAAVNAPVPCAAGVGIVAFPIVTIQDFASITSGDVLSALLNCSSNRTRIALYQVSLMGTARALTNSNFQTGTQFGISGCYQAN